MKMEKPISDLAAVDAGNVPGPSNYQSLAPPGPAVGQKAPSKRSTRPLRPAQSNAPDQGSKPLPPTGQRSTRSSNRPQVSRLKLKFSEKGEVRKAHGSHSHLTSFLGDYSREADEEGEREEGLVFEEQFVLRVPDRVARGDKERGIKGIRTLLEEKKEVGNASFTFKDQRRATFTHGGTEYTAKLVDLPCIVEAQKTLDRKRLFKVADVSQMLVIDPDPLPSAQLAQGHPNPNPNPDLDQDLDLADYVWPHGLTPPMRYVRERRWRRKRDGDLVKAEVDRLLALDKESKSSSFDLLELHSGILSDRSDYSHTSPSNVVREGSSGSVPDPARQQGTPWSLNADVDADGDGDGEGDGFEDADGEGGEGSMLGDFQDDRTDLASLDGDMDMDLEAALNQDEEVGSEEDEDEEEGDDDDDEAEEEEEDEEIVDLRSQQRLLEQEVAALEEMVAKKTREMQNVSAMIKMRIQRDVTKYQADLAGKIKARDENQTRIDAKVEAKDKAREVEGEGEGEVEGRKEEDDYDGLFGDEEEEEDGEEGEEDGQGEEEQREDQEEEDDWDQIFANEEAQEASLPADTPGGQDHDIDAEGDDDDEEEDDEQHDMNPGSGPINLDSPNHQVDHDSDEEEDADGDAEDGFELGAQAPAQVIQPVAPAWPTYADSDESDEED